MASVDTCDTVIKKQTRRRKAIEEATRIVQEVAEDMHRFGNGDRETIIEKILHKSS